MFREHKLIYLLEMLVGLGMYSSNYLPGKNFGLGWLGQVILILEYSFHLSKGLK